MKTVVPSYYHKFKCIADRCRHNCCIGWEIDVDADTLQYYSSLTVELGERIMANISFIGEPHFCLAEGERCPMLNQNNLCDIISQLGEDALCRICADHPRFRNCFDGVTETGLGLCCEAAAELILGETEKVTLVETENDGEDDIPPEDAAFFELRERVLFVAQNRAYGFDERVSQLKAMLEFDLPQKSAREWAEVFLSLERLDESWTQALTALSESGDAVVNVDEICKEQLLVYFIFRHFSGALEDGLFELRLAFAILSVHIICLVCAATGEDVAEVARMYSAEIEYSDENIGVLLGVLDGAGE